jgi:hypothetical protein
LHGAALARGPARARLSSSRWRYPVRWAERVVVAWARELGTTGHGWARSGMKTVRIFFDRIRDWIRLERFRSVRIWVLRIRILKSHINDVDIQSYPIWRS